MLTIDITADLHQEDDDGLNIANVNEARDPAAVHPGAVFVAGKPDGWSWVEVKHVDDGIAHFRQITWREADQLAPLVQETAS